MTQDNTSIGERFGRWVIVDSAPSHVRFRYRQYLCRCDCGTERVVNWNLLKKGRSSSCGCKLGDRNRGKIGSASHLWKGGRGRDGHGYIMCRVYQNGKRTSVREHKLVMESVLGRELFPNESVHHLNGIRDDNRPENLELRLRAEHPSGVSVTDMLKWSRQIIARYEGSPFDV